MTFVYIWDKGSYLLTCCMLTFFRCFLPTIHWKQNKNINKVIFENHKLWHCPFKFSLNNLSTSWFICQLQLCADGYDVTNLVSDDPALRRRGFKLEYFLRPPVQVRLHFLLAYLPAPCLLKGSVWLVTEWWGHCQGVTPPFLFK